MRMKAASVARLGGFFITHHLSFSSKERAASTVVITVATQVTKAMIFSTDICKPPKI